MSTRLPRGLACDVLGHRHVECAAHFRGHAASIGSVPPSHAAPRTGSCGPPSARSAPRSALEHSSGTPRSTTRRRGRREPRHNPMTWDSCYKALHSSARFTPRASLASHGARFTRIEGLTSWYAAMQPVRLLSSFIYHQRTTFCSKMTGTDDPVLYSRHATQNSYSC